MYVKYCHIFVGAYFGLIGLKKILFADIEVISQKNNLCKRYSLTC
jgi:hypothetical protein